MDAGSGLFIPELAAWPLAGFAVVWVFTWLLRLERKQGNSLTRDEHEKICTKNAGEVKETLDEIKAILRGQELDAIVYREKTSEVLDGIKLNVAVLQSNGKIQKLNK